MVQLRQFASEVTRVSLEVGTEGKLGGVAVVEGVEGVWHELTVNVCRNRAAPSARLTSWLTGQSNVSKSDPTSAVDCSRYDSCRPGTCRRTSRYFLHAYCRIYRVI